MHNNSSVTFFTKFVDMTGITFCNYPISCHSVSIKSTIYCVSGDEDIDADVGAIFSEQIGPAITKRGPGCKFNSPVYRNNLSHKIGSLDFFEKVDWKLDNAPTLLSLRYCPNIVAVGDKIFRFGGNRLLVNEHDYVPFAEVFDSVTKQRSLISDPPFPSRIGYEVLFLAPFLGRDGEQKILVMSHAIYVNPPLDADAAALYDVHTDKWETFNDPDRSSCF